MVRAPVRSLFKSLFLGRKRTMDRACRSLFGTKIDTGLQMGSADLSVRVRGLITGAWFE